MSIVNNEQIKASNPLDSVWVSASAGTGKTKVLTDRVLRLLLQTGHPEKLLCLTFTKAAAAEMSNRVHEILQKWAICPDSKLIQELTELTQEQPDENQIKRAKELFTMVLDTPGGMKIMTIHSFCQSLLKRFPLEADVPPHFEVLDDIASKTILEQILNDIFANPQLYSDLSRILSYISANSMDELFHKILDNSEDLNRLTEVYPGGIESIIFAIKQNFDITQYHTEKEIIIEHFNEDEWPAIRTEYLKTDGERYVIKGQKKHLDPQISKVAYEVNERLKKFQIAEATRPLLMLAFRALEQYKNIKTQMAALDYSDLIEKTNLLLTKSTMAAWVLYKLDGGIDHILVDEAQDTNKAQWAIIKALAEEFFSGEGKSDQLRTLFVVGDKKQSIYSFQGADPAEFERMRVYFEQKIIDSQNTFQNIPLNFSFRSTEPVLRLVNYLLEDEQAKNGVLLNNETAHHIANRDQDAGSVEIWPLEEDEEETEQDAWTPPITRQETDSARTRLITKMVDKIELMIGREILKSKNRLIRPGDILILLQKRGKMMGEIVRMMNERHIPVAGVDRLVLSDHLAIQDLMALTEFVLQPENDLNLANLIKSPILNLNEQDLYNICINRGQDSVWTRLKQLYPEKANILKNMMNLADQTPPFEFYSTILGSYGARKRIVARFGVEVNEALDEFLNLSLNFEKTHTPSLQNFLDWFNKHKIEIKRDLDNSGMDAVRIMTVHGSKGLQGNIVFLPDTRSTKSASEQGGQIIWLDNNLPIWVPMANMRPAVLKKILEQKKYLDQQERRRLLYVAVTRASDCLYIGGFGKGDKNNWYDLVKNAVLEKELPDQNGIIKWESNQRGPIKQKDHNTLPLDFENIPIWVNKIPEKELPPPKPISPSKLGEDKEIIVETSIMDKDQELALKRGSFLHKLLQYLPMVPSEQRLEIAQNLCPPDIELPDNLLTIFEKPNLKDLFGPNSLAEVPVVGEIDGQPVSGQIDRLVVLKDEVKIVDFKTNRFVPKTVPEMYKKQLNAYKDLLKQIFPDKMIKTYLLWTQTLYFQEVE